MFDTVLMSVLPYAVLGGVAASIVASLGLTMSALLQRRQSHSDLLPRLNELEKAIRRDTFQIDTQLRVAGHGSRVDSTRSVVSDLSIIAEDLQKRAAEIHRILSEIRSDRTVSDDIDNRKKIVSLELAVGQTEDNIEAVVRRIEKKQQELSEL